MHSFLKFAWIGWGIGILGALPLQAFGFPAIEEQIRSHQWQKAVKDCKRAAARLAKTDGDDAEREKVAEIALLRALAEAGRGDPRLADWYWWVSGMFGDLPSADSLPDRYGAAGTALQTMIRPIPDPKPVSTDSIDKDALARTLTKRQGRPTLMAKACRRQKGEFRFLASSGQDGYFQAPRLDPEYPLVARPICGFAVLESYRDQRYGLTVGFVNRLTEHLEIQRGRPR